MFNLQKKLDELLNRGPDWEARLRAAVRAEPSLADKGAETSLTEIQDFGSNPGALRMFEYVPPHLASGSALVLVLHGCGQTAAGYDHGAGWSTLAERFGFALLLPQQQSSNNPNNCFNWFSAGDIERGRGEALSIRQMIEKMINDHRIDRSRVHVTGLSAGGAMTSVMLATYPDVFAGGAIVAGLPYGAASNVQEAFESMFQSPPRPAREWGDLVRGASPHNGPWPRVSVWHGGADTMVVPSNSAEILKQWTDVHGLPSRPTFTETVDGHERNVWRNAAGQEVLESFTIEAMAHGTPLDVGMADDQCGAAGAFLLDVGISSSYHIAKFWGLTGRAEPAAKPASQAASPASRQRPLPTPGITLAEPVAEIEPEGVPRSVPVDIRSIITNALKAAGLMKAP